MRVCTHCGKEIASIDFCSPAHKMAYRRGKVLPESNKDVFVLPNSNKPIEKPSDKKWCEHGAMVGLCKQGCKK